MSEPIDGVKLAARASRPISSKLPHRAANPHAKFASSLSLQACVDLFRMCEVVKGTNAIKQGDVTSFMVRSMSFSLRLGGTN
jgi:hypothetical protein